MGWKPSERPSLWPHQVRALSDSAAHFSHVSTRLQIALRQSSRLKDFQNTDRRRRRRHSLHGNTLEFVSPHLYNGSVVATAPEHSLTLTLTLILTLTLTLNIKLHTHPKPHPNPHTHPNPNPHVTLTLTLTLTVTLTLTLTLTVTLTLTLTVTLTLILTLTLTSPYLSLF